MNRRGRRWGAVAALVAAAGCGGDTPPQPAGPAFDGGYQLESVNGRPLPYAYYCFQTSCAELLGGRVEVMSRGRLRYIERRLPGPGAQPVTDTVVNAYALDGAQLVIERAYVGGSVSSYADTGAVEAAGRLLLRPHLIHVYANSATLLYVKD